MPFSIEQVLVWPALANWKKSAKDSLSNNFPVLSHNFRVLPGAAERFCYARYTYDYSDVVFRTENAPVISVTQEHAQECGESSSSVVES